MGVVFHIQHYAIHDGPGIRTIIFLKGCPLDCPWCHNPESKRVTPEFMWTSERCIKCGSCVESCSYNAISFNPCLRIDEKRCIQCGKCVEVCYAEALVSVGVDMPVETVMTEIDKDQPFYEGSGGGVTFSGGEPLMQPKFLRELLKNCRKRGIHTAIARACAQNNNGDELNGYLAIRNSRRGDNDSCARSLLDLDDNQFKKIGYPP